MKGKNSVQRIINSSICSACGACMAICPKHAISFKRNNSNFLSAIVDINLCVDCGQCIMVCPSDIDNVAFLLNKERDNWDSGSKILAGFVGHATDMQIRSRGQSGGVVTALLVNLLQSRAIEGALVNHFDIPSQQQDVFFANTVGQLQSAQGSYYLQSAVLKNINKYVGKKIAVVATGCQSEALELCQRMNYSRPYLTIGLVCEGIYSLNYMYDLIDESDNSLNIKECMFRDKRKMGWPGDVYIASDKKIYRRSPNDRVFLKPCYALYKCMQCFDMNNIFADIVVGDPWCFRSEYSEAELNKGKTVIIARTKRGMDVLKKAELDGDIYLEEKDAEKFFYHNSYKEGRVNKTKKIVELCFENDLPTIYKSIAMLKLSNSQKNNKTFKSKKLLEEILHAYNYYNAQTVEYADRLIKIKKKILLKEKLLSAPRIIFIRMLVKIRNLCIYIINFYRK